MPKVPYDRQAARRKPTEAQLYRSALKVLVEKLDLIAADPEFQSMAVMAFIHGQAYTGPNWAAELERAKTPQIGQDWSYRRGCVNWPFAQPEHSQNCNRWWIAAQRQIGR